MKEKFLNFYSKHKKGVWIVGIIVVIFLGFNLFGGHEDEVKWDDLLLKSHIPEVKKGSIRSGSNLDDYLSFTVKNVKKSYYDEYKKSCIDMGYTIESEESGNRYEAYNSEGYELSITYYSTDSLSITLNAPEEMSEITWTTSGLGAKLPTPTSTYGKVISDSSNAYKVLLGKTTLAEFNKYVSACQEKGFNVDYNKQEKSYHAKDKEGYRLSVTYAGGNTMDIMIQIPSNDTSDNNNNNSDKDDASDKNDVDENKSDKPDNNTDMVDGMRKDFKAAMDSYEAFIDEYVSFMKKYSANPSDMSLLKDLATYSNKLTQFEKDFDKWDAESMNTKEAAYYLEVQTRVNKKLLEVAS